MRSVEEQQARIKQAVVTPEPVRTGISEALGLRSAERVESDISLPHFNQAAIDGYAVRAVDLREANPENVQLRLPIVGDVDAGSSRPLRLQPHQVVRVQAGSPLPTLADAVLPLDWARVENRHIIPIHPVLPGEFVHREGTDVQQGDVVVEQGAIIGAAQIGLLAAIGRSKVLVYPKPRLSVMSYGEELVDIDSSLAPGQVRDVNSYSLSAAGREAGAEVHRVGILQGEERRLRESIEGQLMRTEILVIAGGIGGRASDKLREILDELGHMEYERVGMHPGSVQGFGLLGKDSVPTFLLPANPSAALVTFDVMVRPLIQALRGIRQGNRRLVKARTVSAMESIPGRTGYIRGQLMRDRETQEFLVDPLGATGVESTHLLGSHGQANCMIVLPEEVQYVVPGEFVDVQFMTNRV